MHFCFRDQEQDNLYIVPKLVIHFGHLELFIRGVNVPVRLSPPFNSFIAIRKIKFRVVYNLRKLSHLNLRAETFKFSNF